MLVLTRKVDEGIVIGDNIKIRVIAVEGNKVKLGVVAEKDIPIIREEILESVKNENLSAGQVDDTNLDWNVVMPREDKTGR
ncbi:MAG: carbon storage regulator CsrA [Syntrophomonadaceae bacterium]|nr:carbon storage regulator CsrA [Syntrophomonadaceae bacterium]